jgi:hypothetical protein
MGLDWNVEDPTGLPFLYDQTFQYLQRRWFLLTQYPICCIFHSSQRNIHGRQDHIPSTNCGLLRSPHRRHKRNLQQVVGAGHFGADAYAGGGAASREPFGPQRVEGGALVHVFDVDRGLQQLAFARASERQRALGLGEQGQGLAANVGAAFGHFYKVGGAVVYDSV